MYAKYIKRILDFIISLFALIILSPLLILVIIWLYFANEGAGVFFKQTRLGKGQTSFEIIKFKSMSDKRGQDGNLLPDVERLTKMGKFIRRFKIDEIPQLINVIKGDMSLIGPRPDVPSNLKNYTKFAKKRFGVRPGMTGLAQVNGNIFIDWSERWKYDVAYIERLTMCLDIHIIVKTILVVVLGEKLFKNESRINWFGWK